MSGLFDEPVTVAKPKKISKKQQTMAAPAPKAKVIPIRQTDDERNIIEAVAKFKNAGMI